MKRLILMLSVVFSISCFAQNKAVLITIPDVAFYGVDFSRVKVYGAEEKPYQFQGAFDAINHLFISEQKKYDVSKFFHKEVVAIDQEEVHKRIESMNLDDLITSDMTYQITEDALKDMIRKFPTDRKEGTGLIVVAEMLNKSESKGYYHVVFFDLATKDILDTWKSDAKARGFGLRNYWARSIYDVMKKAKI